MFRFNCIGPEKQLASFNVDSLYATELGNVAFCCNNDEFAISLLSKARCDSAGFFSILSGCKPLHLEQWLTYLQETHIISRFTIDQIYDDECILPQAPTIEQTQKDTDESKQQLINLIYQLAGFDKLKIARFFKNRRNISLLATRYDTEDLERYKKLTQLHQLLAQLLK